MFNDFPQPLLQPHMLGDLLLTNRVVMAPLIRGRAHNPWHVPNEQRPEGYYGATAFGYTAYPFLTVNDLHAGTEVASLSLMSGRRVMPSKSFNHVQPQRQAK
jgi:2,4-dienoyl-CoA reductase-like NADH-dependent reductase (Old Yellow Enzyme family)